MKIDPEGYRAIEPVKYRRNRRKKEKAQSQTSGVRRKPSAGNGHGPTKSQALLLMALRIRCPLIDWEAEYPVRTATRLGTGYPTNYKLDIACPSYKLGIECDGKSHDTSTARRLDTKKNNFLISLGWQVIRIRDEVIMSDIQECVEGIAKVVDAIETAATDSNGF